MSNNNILMKCIQRVNYGLGLHVSSLNPPHIKILLYSPYATSRVESMIEFLGRMNPYLDISLTSLLPILRET